ncbi:MAG: transposase [Gammaproteobacteria bacterium]
MVHYRRRRVPGGTHFFTVTLRNRKSALLTDNIGLLRAAFRQVHPRRPYTLDAAVILPDHLHVVMALPDFDFDYSGRWRAIKSLFVRYLRRAHGLVERVVDWPYSSFGRYVRAGVLPMDWGGRPVAENDGAFAE